VGKNHHKFKSFKINVKYLLLLNDVSFRQSSLTSLGMTSRKFLWHRVA